MKSTLRVYRYDPATDAEPRYDLFEIEVQESEMVLGALQRIYNEHDPSMALQYGCRFKNCGLCGMKINGIARMACLTPIKEELVIEPLDHVEVEKDLVVDRNWVNAMMRNHELFVQGDGAAPDEGFATVQPGPEFDEVSKCTECMCCISADPTVERASPEDGSVLMFVKLAQLHFNPRDTVDRVVQAQRLGVARYSELTKTIGCPYGIHLRGVVFEPLMGKGTQVKLGKNIINTHE